MRQSEERTEPPERRPPAPEEETQGGDAVSLLDAEITRPINAAMSEPDLEGGGSDADEHRERGGA